MSVHIPNRPNLTFAEHCKHFDITYRFLKYKGNTYLIVTSQAGYIDMFYYHNYIIRPYFPNAKITKHNRFQTSFKLGSIFDIMSQL